MHTSSLLCFLSLALLAVAVRADDEQVTELKIETVKEGDCTRTAKAGDNLLMHYAGTLTDGTEFDSSYKRKEPFSFTLGTGMVIKGWDKGLEGICKGEVRNLVIPHDLAYGDAGYPPIIPEKATLKFKVELVGWSNGNEEL